MTTSSALQSSGECGWEKFLKTLGRFWCVSVCLGVGGRGGVLIDCLPLRIWPLPTRPFRDRPPLFLLDRRTDAVDIINLHNIEFLAYLSLLLLFLGFSSHHRRRRERLVLQGLAGYQCFTFGLGVLNISRCKIKAHFPREERTLDSATIWFVYEKILRRARKPDKQPYYQLPSTLC